MYDLLLHSLPGQIYLACAAITFFVAIVYSPKPYITDAYGMEGWWLMNIAVALGWPLFLVLVFRAVRKGVDNASDDSYDWMIIGGDDE